MDILIRINPMLNNIESVNMSSTTNTPYKCNECGGMPFSSMEELEMHNEKQHPTNISKDDGSQKS